MDQLPTISPPQRAKFRRKSVPPRPKTVAARPRRPPPRLSARRRVCCSHPPRRLPTTSPTQQAKLRRGSVSARTNTVAARPRMHPHRLSRRRRVCRSPTPRPPPYDGVRTPSMPWEPRPRPRRRHPRPTRYRRAPAQRSRWCTRRTASRPAGATTCASSPRRSSKTLRPVDAVCCCWSPHGFNTR